MTTRVPGDLRPYTMQDEQRAQPTVERSQAILPSHRDLWVLIGILIVVIVLVLIAVVRL